jgi:putative ABC transport system substrate-binding protein
VSHITLFAPKIYGILGELYGLSPINAAGDYSMIRRREFIAGLGLAAAWPLAALAQQRPAMPVIGWLGGESREVDDFGVIPFLQGLKDSGHIEGRNVTIECRCADGQYERLPALAAEA